MTLVVVEDVHPDFVEGYRDGLDPNTPEPNANRSAKYRHSFAVGRFERAKQPAFGSYENARRLADLAEEEDARA